MRKTCLGLLLSFLFVAAIAFHAGAAADKQVPKIGPVKINAHPANLEGKTVVLRWNGKPNGDKFLTRFGKVVKMWEMDKTTAVISKTPETSKAIADKIAAYKPAIVIASQAD
jgi:hypothetical protein